MGAPLLTKTLLNRRWRNQTTTKVQHWPFKKHHPNLFKGEPVKVPKRRALHFIIRRALFTTPRKQAAVIILLQLKSSATDNNAHRVKMFTLGLQRCCTALHQILKNLQPCLQGECYINIQFDNNTIECPVKVYKHFTLYRSCTGVYSSSALTFMVFCLMNLSDNHI